MLIDRDNLIAVIKALPLVLLIIGGFLWVRHNSPKPDNPFYEITCPCPDGTSEINIFESDYGSARRYTADCSGGDGNNMVRCTSELLGSGK